MQNSKKFDIEFNNECELILNQVYHNSLDMGDTGLKRAVVKTEKRYIDYLIEINLIKNLNSGSAGEYGIQLERKGFEVFEKYNGFKNYQEKVLKRDNKINRAKEMAIKFWWLPIIISVLSLTVAIISLCTKK